jgi:2Fe-2S ferredoxin
MPKINYLPHDGEPVTVDVEEGGSVMQAAVAHNVPGILAECGGACACATCVVLIDPSCVSLIPPPGPVELSMLEDDDTQDGMPRRLSCQIKVTKELDGLIVHVPPAAYH